MDRDLDRRAVFLFGSAVLCLLLIPLTLPKLRWVGELLVVTQVVLGCASLLDHRSRKKRNRS